LTFSEELHNGKKSGRYANIELKESLNDLREAIYDPLLLDISRTRKGAFTRKREGGMGFPDALCFMLDMNKTTLHSRLNRFHREIKGGKSITQQAFSKLRRILATRLSR